MSDEEKVIPLEEFQRRSHAEDGPPVESQAKLFERLDHPDRQWVILAGGDHAAHLENSGPRFVHAIVTFLDRPR